MDVQLSAFPPSRGSPWRRGSRRGGLSVAGSVTLTQSVAAESKQIIVAVTVVEVLTFSAARAVGLLGLNSHTARSAGVTWSRS